MNTKVLEKGRRVTSNVSAQSTLMKHWWKNFYHSKIRTIRCASSRFFHLLYASYSFAWLIVVLLSVNGGHSAILKFITQLFWLFKFTGLRVFLLWLIFFLFFFLFFFNHVLTFLHSGLVCQAPTCTTAAAAHQWQQRKQLVVWLWRK